MLQHGWFADWREPIALNHSPVNSLPVEFRLRFKMFTMPIAFKALSGLGPNFFCKRLCWYWPTRSLCSYPKNLLQTPFSLNRVLRQQNVFRHCCRLSVTLKVWTPSKRCLKTYFRLICSTFPGSFEELVWNAKCNLGFGSKRAEDLSYCIQQNVG